MGLGQGEVLSPEGMLAKLFQDMYLGNGKPAVTIRLDAVETSQKRIERLLMTLIVLCAGTFLTVAGELILKVLK